MRSTTEEAVAVERHAFDFDCGCAGCEDCAWPVEEMGEDCLCGECGHLVLADVGAWTSDDPAEYRP